MCVYLTLPVCVLKRFSDAVVKAGHKYFVIWKLRVKRSQRFSLRVSFGY